MNWEKIIDWAFFFVAAFVEAMFLFGALKYSGTPAMFAYLQAALWLFLFVIMRYIANQHRQVAKSSLAGWDETIKNNDTLISMIHGLKDDLKEKDDLLKQKTIVVASAPLTIARPAKRLKVKTADVKRRRKLRR